MPPIVQLLIFSLLATGLIIAGLIVCKKTVKSQKAKNLIFLIAAIMVLVIHYSSVLYHLIADAELVIENNMYLPVYPCNIIMWLAFVLALMNKKCEGFKIIGEFTFVFGTICVFIGFFANINFLNNPDWSDFDIVKGLVSHVVLAFACLYLGVMGYVKIRTIHTTISCILGVVLFMLCGGFTILVNFLCGFEQVNTMFMLEPPFPEIPWINMGFIIPVGLVILFGGLTLYEIIALPKEERWYHKIKKQK